MVYKTTKLYDIVKKLLEGNPILRDSDPMLYWEVWKIDGSVKDNELKRDDFLLATNSESIRRVRQKIQEHYPHLRSSLPVRRYKAKKEEMKGNFVYQEKLRPVVEFTPDGRAIIRQRTPEPVQQIIS